MSKAVKTIILALVFVLLAGAAGYIIMERVISPGETAPEAASPPPAAEPAPEPTPAPPETGEGYAASTGAPVELLDANFAPAGEAARGTALVYELTEPVEHGGAQYRKITLPQGGEGYIAAESLAEDYTGAVLETRLFVRTAVDLLAEPDGLALSALADKGAELTVTGFDTLDETGAVHMYQVECESGSGWVRPWYLEETAEAAAEVYDDGGGMYQRHVDCGDKYGGGDAASLDYWPRDKAMEPANPMPATCKTLFLPCYTQGIESVRDWIDVADGCDINAFVVDICDNTSIGYPSPVMERYAPTSYGKAQNSMESYAAAVRAIKDAGYYVIGRITCFHDDDFCADNPQCAISNTDGSLKKVAGGWWPSVYSRYAWEYKVALALEAAELFGFDEIQFDYVRFPDNTYDSERAGSIDFKNAYGENKAQAIQRFLMYATDALHEKNVYVSADVFGETSNYYVAAYGQYWPAISNVVDAISAMPYPDHYSSEGSWNPWEHPYDIISMFAAGAVLRQQDCPTPAAVRPWIQCYDSIKEPTVYYYAENVGAEIQALYDAGITGGWITWNSGGDLYHYSQCQSAFNLDPASPA